MKNMGLFFFDTSVEAFEGAFPFGAAFALQRSGSPEFGCSCLHTLPWSSLRSKGSNAHFSEAHPRGFLDPAEVC